MAVKKPTSKTPAKSRTGSSKSKLNSLPKVNKWLALLFVAVIAGVGAYIIFRANAATNNCQTIPSMSKVLPAGTDKAATNAGTQTKPADDKNAVQVCDVDMALGSDTTVLSTKGWADELGKQGFWYFGAVFRAPTTAFAGAVPISAVFNESTTYRDYMTVAQKSLKDSAFPGKTKNEGVAFYAWEKPGQPDTVPVYRITQGGSATKTFYSTDLGTINRLLAEDQNNPDGWKKDQFAGSSFIAFYAFPPNYAVSKQPNPYDCSIQANYVSDRCNGPRAALDTAVAAGNVPVGKDCPATLEIYRKAPFASQFDQACQDKWNTYMNDCSIQENLVSDRCKNERQAQADAQAEQARLRAADAVPAVPAAPAFKPSGGGGGGGGGGGVGGGGPNPESCNKKCQRDQEQLRNWNAEIDRQKAEAAAAATRARQIAAWVEKYQVGQCYYTRVDSGQTAPVTGKKVTKPQCLKLSQGMKIFEKQFPNSQYFFYFKAATGGESIILFRKSGSREYR